MICFCLASSLPAQHLTFSTYLGGSGADSASAIAIDSTGNIFVAGVTTSTDFPVTKAAQSASGGAFVAKLDSAGARVLAVYYQAGISIDGLVLDAAGNPVIAGTMASAGILAPTTGAYSTPKGTGFVAKLSPALDKFLWISTFSASPAALALDSAGNVYTTGSADSGFRTTAAAFQPVFAGGSIDAFAMKLSADGSAALYATFLGGTAEDQANAIAVDSAGQAYITGATGSKDFPLSQAAQSKFGGRLTFIPYWYGDAFVTKLDAVGATLIYSTYLGGAAADAGYAITVDSSGNAYVTGGTESTGLSTAGVFQPKYAGPAADPSFPDTAGDAFVARYSSAGALTWLTYLGGANYDYAAAIAVDPAGNVMVSGVTDSTDFPKAGTPPHDCHIGGHPFIAQLDRNGAKLLLTAGTAGIGYDQPAAMVFDAARSVVWLAGDTASLVFFSSPGAAQTTYGGGDSDVFAARIDLTLAPGLVAGCVLNAASFQAGNTAPFPTGAVAPGEIISIFGAGLGPDTPVTSPHITPAGLVDTNLGGTQVFFDGIAAPLLYVGPTQINAVVPYGVKAPSTKMTVSRGGATAGPVTMPVVAAVPGIFTYDGSGSGAAAALNQDFTYNTPSNPVSRGQIITFFACGAGLMTGNGSTDGGVTSTTVPPEQQPVPQLPVTVTIRGTPAQLVYWGAAPGYASGLLQINAIVPTTIDFGDHAPLFLNIGTFSSQLNISIAEK